MSAAKNVNTSLQIAAPRTAPVFAWPLKVYKPSIKRHYGRGLGTLKRAAAAFPVMSFSLRRIHEIFIFS